MKTTYTSGGIVLNDKKEVLVVNQNNNSWSLPKGHIDLGEDALTAAIREIYEESGVEKKDITLIKELGSYKRYKIGLDGNDDKSELKIIYMFLFESKNNQLKPIDPANPEALWVDKNKVAEMLTHDKDKEFFTNWLKSTQE